MRWKGADINKQAECRFGFDTRPGMVGGLIEGEVGSGGAWREVCVSVQIRQVIVVCVGGLWGLAFLG